MNNTPRSPTLIPNVGQLSQEPHPPAAPPPPVPMNRRQRRAQHAQQKKFVRRITKLLKEKSSKMPPGVTLDYVPPK